MRGTTVWLCITGALAGFGGASLVTPAAAQENAAVASVGLDSVVVTAQRRTQNLQLVPIAVSHVSGAALNETGAVTIESLNRLAPNAVIEHVGLYPGYASLSIRGVGYAGVESYADPEVAVYVNGVYLGRNATALTSTVDVDNIEILRGPQGTLYGQNAFAGAISVRTKKPNLDETSGAVAASFGNFGKQDFDFIGNLPLSDGKFAARIAIRNHHLDGYYRNNGVVMNDVGAISVDPALRGRKIGREDNLYVRPTLRWSGASWDVNLFGEYYRNRDSASPAGHLVSTGPMALRAIGLPGANPFGDKKLNLPGDGSDPFSIGFSLDSQANRLNQYNYTADIAHNTDIGAFRLIVNYNDADQLQRADTDGENINAYSSTRYEDYSAYSAEAQFVSDFSNVIDLTAGASYFHDKYQTTQLTFSDTTLPLPAQFTPATSQNPPTIGPAYINSEGNRTALAAYAQFEFHTTSKLSFVAGGRYSDENKRGERGENTSLSAARIAPTADFSAHPFTANAALIFTAPEIKASNFAPRLGVNYRASEDLLLFAFWQRAFKSGGYNANSADKFAFVTPYGEERVDNYEIGLRSEWFDRRLRANANAFYADYQGLQRSMVTPSASATSGVTTVTSNAADLKSTGVELSLAAKVTSDLSLYSNIGWNDAYYSSFCADLDGATLSPVAPPGRTICGPIRSVNGYNLIPVDNSYLVPIRAPRWDVTAGGAWSRATQAGVLTADLSGNFRGGAYVNLLNVPYSYREPMFILDGSVTLAPKRTNVSVALWGKNLTDDVGILNNLPVAASFVAYHSTQPRMYGATLSAKF